MRWTQTFIPTLKEVPAEAEIPGHQLMLRSGMIRQLMAGAYTFMPLGYRSVRKVSQIVRDSGISTGNVTVFVRHTSASLVIMENADPSARKCDTDGAVC